MALGPRSLSVPLRFEHMHNSWHPFAFPLTSPGVLIGAITLGNHSPFPSA